MEQWSESHWMHFWIPNDEGIYDINSLSDIFVHQVAIPSLINLSFKRNLHKYIIEICIIRLFETWCYIEYYFNKCNVID